MSKDETKEHQDKFYAHKIGKETYITSRRQIVHGEYFMRMNEIYRYDEKFGKVNSNPIIGSTDFYFGYENVGKDEEGKTIANQIGGGNGVLVNAPMMSNVPRVFRDMFEKDNSIYEVNVEFFPTKFPNGVERDGITIKTVTPV
jgi:hypothetical protein